MCCKQVLTILVFYLILCNIIVLLRIYDTIAYLQSFFAKIGNGF